MDGPNFELGNCENRDFWPEDSNRLGRFAASIGRLVFSKRTAGLVLAAGTLVGSYKIYSLGSEMVRNGEESERMVVEYKRQNGIDEDTPLQEAYCHGLAETQAIESSNQSSEQPDATYHINYNKAYEACIADTQFMVPMPALKPQATNTTTVN